MFLAKVAELDQKARKLEARRDRLDPAARLEMSRLETFVTEARRILANGSIVIRDDGLWVSASEGGVHEEFHLGASRLQPSRPAIKLRLRTVEGVDPPFDLRVLQHFWEGPTAQLASMRRLLETFQVRVVAFPDRIETRGLLPTKVIERIGDQVSCSGYRGGTDDHLLDKPIETIDAIRNSAMMKGVLGWLNQPEAAISARAKISRIVTYRGSLRKE